MGKALYRKYRPKSLVEVVGQEHITNTLANAIKAGKISHAYLLTGPRGVGKTSIARILAHEINGLEYDDDKAAHLDIIEIDAASNRRIDEIRDLRDKVHVLPTSSKYKVYIIDEVHMLTREAFNALLKTLEEPPEHAIFILATTEAHKLPETIISRTQHFSFKPIEHATIVEHLRGITKSEKVVVDDEALELIAEHGEGSFRDSISLLDQARSISDKVTGMQVQQLLGIAPSTVIEDLLKILDHGSAKDLFELLAELRGQGLQSAVLAKQLSQKLRGLIIEDASFQNVRSTSLLQSLLGVSASGQPDRQLEIVLLEYIFANNQTLAAPKPENVMPEIITNVPKTSKLVAKAETSVLKAPNKDVLQPEVNEIKNDHKPKILEKLKTSKPEAVSDKHFTQEAWPLVVAAVKKTNNTVYGILRMADAVVADGTLKLSFKFPFHQKQINEAKNRKIIEDIIKQQSGEDVVIKCVVAKMESDPVKKQNNASHIDTVSNIFGGGEVLES